MDCFVILGVVTDVRFDPVVALAIRECFGWCHIEETPNVGTRTAETLRSSPLRRDEVIQVLLMGFEPAVKLLFHSFPFVCCFWFKAGLKIQILYSRTYSKSCIKN
jgi:hypothetical protein